MTSLELERFELEDGVALKDTLLASNSKVPYDKDPIHVDVTLYKVLKNVFLST